VIREFADSLFETREYSDSLLCKWRYQLPGFLRPSGRLQNKTPRSLKLVSRLGEHSLVVGVRNAASLAGTKHDSPSSAPSIWQYHPKGMPFLHTVRVDISQAYVAARWGSGPPTAWATQTGMYGPRVDSYLTVVKGIIPRAP